MVKASDPTSKTSQIRAQSSGPALKSSLAKDPVSGKFIRADIALENTKLREWETAGGEKFSMPAGWEPSGTEVSTEKGGMTRIDSAEITPAGKPEAGAVFNPTGLPYKPERVTYKYGIGVEYPEQAQDVEKWASSQGATVRRVQETEEEMRSRFAAGDTAPIKLIVTTGKELPPNASIDIRAAETVKQARLETTAAGAGQKIYERANPLEKVGLHVRTLLSPEGATYLGALSKEYRGPLSVIHLVLPPMKSTEEIVKEETGKRTAAAAAGKPALLYDIVPVGKMGGLGEIIISAVDNPIVDTATAALGGAGLAKIAATKTGAKILGSKAGKIGLGLAVAAYGGQKTAEVVSLVQAGKTEEALGKAEVALAGLGVGAAAYKAQLADVKTAKVLKSVEIAKSEIAGSSVSAGAGKDVTVSRGKFVILEGELKGLKGQTAAVSGEKRGIVKVTIPEQKLGEVKVPAQEIISYTAQKRIGQTPEKLDVFVRRSADKAIAAGEETVLFGPHKEVALVKETSRVEISGAQLKTGEFDILGKRGEPVATVAETMPADVTVRKFKAVSMSETYRDYNFFLVKSGERVGLLERGVLTKRGLAKVDWVDMRIEKSAAAPDVNIPGPRAPAGEQRGQPGRPSTVSTLDVRSPAIPSGKIKAEIRSPSIGEAGTAGRRRPPGTIEVPKTGLKIDVAPIAVGAVRIEGREKSESRTASRMDQRVRMAPVSIPGSASLVGAEGKVRNVPVMAVVEIPLQSSRERSAVLSRLASLPDVMPPHTVIATPPVAVETSPPVIPGMGLIPMFTLGGVFTGRKKVPLIVVKNPVPDISELI